MSIPSINQKQLILEPPTASSKPCVRSHVSRPHTETRSIQPTHPSLRNAVLCDRPAEACAAAPITGEIPFIIVSGIVITKTGIRSGRHCDPVLCLSA